MKLPIEQMSEATASREVRPELLTDWLAARAGAGGAARPGTVAWTVVPSGDAAATTGTGACAPGTTKNCWQVGHLIRVPT